MPTIRNKYFQLIPGKVIENISDIENNIKPNIKGYMRENLFEVVSIVACNVRKEGEPAQLQITYIKKLVPQGDKYLQGLIIHNVVQRTGNAVIGKTSYQYNFTQKYFSKFNSVALNNQKLIYRIEKTRHQKNKASKVSIRGHSEQIKYLKLLTIDDGYMDYISVTYADEIEKYNSALASATRIVNKDIFYKIDNTGRRFHSNLTNIARGLRQYLRINNEPLVNLDIKNSQPFISILVLLNPYKVAFLTENKAFAMLLQCLKVPQNEDVKKYVKLVVDGQFYEYLMNEFIKGGLELPADPKERRDAVKKHVLRILFARNRMPKDLTNKKARQIFIQRFPTVHKAFSKIRGNNKGDKFSNFKRFSILLQRIESYLLLKIILKRIYKELPGTIATTIHDSILTGILTNNVDAVREIMMDELTFFVGFRPNIKIEGINRKYGEI